MSNFLKAASIKTWAPFAGKGVHIASHSLLHWPILPPRLSQQEIHFTTSQSIKSTPHRRNFEGPKGLAISFQAQARSCGLVQESFDPKLGLLTLVQTPVYPSLVPESGWCAASCPRRVEIATFVDRVSLHSHLPSRPSGSVFRPSSRCLPALDQTCSPLLPHIVSTPSPHQHFWGSI
ncbi:Uncharacterized protein HZ326_6472 [Fusarium oxysporum f. sp. albedinis]|nr:Uncharacterized protein HZ326_6472 [Fusarium oxysporum f. sp. albedinis]